MFVRVKVIKTKRSHVEVRIKRPKWQQFISY